MNVLDAIDYVSLHMLPYFAQGATTGGINGKAWSNNMYDMNQILGYTNSSKKILWTQTGWPSSEFCIEWQIDMIIVLTIVLSYSPLLSWRLPQFGYSSFKCE